ncbi:hypothetical protein K438DRAFT_1752756 [Mycena galopus ATCC 62051]|nr:hypothetical protein K438DRAFT_1752756 [Mycena galopus ATCC 62051]
MPDSPAIHQRSGALHEADGVYRTAATLEKLVKFVHSPHLKPPLGHTEFLQSRGGKIQPQSAGQPSGVPRLLERAFNEAVVEGGSSMMSSTAIVRCSKNGKAEITKRKTESVASSKQGLRCNTETMAFEMKFEESRVNEGATRGGRPRNQAEGSASTWRERKGVNGRTIKQYTHYFRKAADVQGSDTSVQLVFDLSNKMSGGNPTNRAHAARDEQVDKRESRTYHRLVAPPREPTEGHNVERTPVPKGHRKIDPAITSCFFVDYLGPFLAYKGDHNAVGGASSDGRVQNSENRFVSQSTKMASWLRARKGRKLGHDGQARGTAREAGSKHETQEERNTAAGRSHKEAQRGITEHGAQEERGYATEDKPAVRGATAFFRKANKEAIKH